MGFAAIKEYPKIANEWILSGTTSKLRGSLFDQFQEVALKYKQRVKMVNGLQKYTFVVLSKRKDVCFDIVSFAISELSHDIS